MKKVLLFFCLCLTSACSLLGSSENFLTVKTSEPDAQIFINGSYIGNGDIQILVPSNENVSVLVKKEGFYTDQREIGTKISGLGILDTLGGCIFLLPWIGLAFPGAWELDQPNIAIILERK